MSYVYANAVATSWAVKHRYSRCVRFSKEPSSRRVPVHSHRNKSNDDLIASTFLGVEVCQRACALCKRFFLNLRRVQVFGEVSSVPSTIKMRIWTVAVWRVHHILKRSRKGGTKSGKSVSMFTEPAREGRKLSIDDQSTRIHNGHTTPVWSFGGGNPLCSLYGDGGQQVNGG